MKTGKTDSKHRLGDILSMTVEGVAPGGDGVGRIDNMVCFAPYTARGDRVAVRLTQINKRFLKGVVCEIEAAGPHRIAPPCPRFGTCGGCSWMHISPEEQRRAKAEILAHALELDNVEVAPSPGQLGYRGRARLHIELDATETRIGFRGTDPDEIIDLHDCPVLSPALNAALPFLHGALPPLSPLKGEVLLSQGRNGVAAHFMFHAPTVHRSIYAALAALPGAVFCTVSLTVDGIESRLFGNAVIETDGTDSAPFFFPHASFGQANTGINFAIASFIAGILEERRFQKGIELFAGAGNHSITAARFADTYVVSELDPKACEQAAANLAARGFQHAKVFPGDALEVYTKHGDGADLVLLNPPRTGHAALAEAMAAKKPAAVLYVSCNPATLARDIARLTEVGYRIRRVRGFDMFPHTSHIEAAVLLTL